MPDAIDLSGDDDLGRAAEGADRLSGAVDQLTPRIRELQSGANGFARAMTSAFTSSVIGGRQFDDVLKTLALRLSDTALKSALAPITRGLATGISQLFSGLFGGAGGAAVAAARRRAPATPTPRIADPNSPGSATARSSTTLGA